MKTDILREIMYFSYDPQSLANLYPLYAEDVWDIIRMNRNGERPASLKDDTAPMPEFVTAVGDDAINRFDEARKRKKKKRSGSKKKADAPQNAEPAQQESRRENGERREGNGGRGEGGRNRGRGHRRDNKHRNDKKEE